MTAPLHDASKESRRALASAYDDVLKADQQRRDAARRPAARRTPWFGILSLVLLAGTVGWLAVDRPAWLFPPAPVQSPSRDDAGLRLTMYAAAMRLDEYRSTAKRYPMRLEEVPGIATRDLRYERQNDTLYVLRGRRGNAMLTLSSRDALEPFLGESLAKVLQRGGR